MIKVGLIGYGYWGRNLFRNLSADPKFDVRAVAEPREDRIELVRSLAPTIRTTAEAEDTIGDVDIDAVVIATPVRYHFSMASSAIEAGKHVLVEKPMAFSEDEAWGAERAANFARPELLLASCGSVGLYRLSPPS